LSLADGDFVILHVHIKLQPEELGLAVVEIFRLEHGKIVEHWDVRPIATPRGYVSERWLAAVAAYAGARG